MSQIQINNPFSVDWTEGRLVRLGKIPYEVGNDWSVRLVISVDGTLFDLTGSKLILTIKDDEDAPTATEVRDSDTVITGDTKKQIEIDADQVNNKGACFLHFTRRAEDVTAMTPLIGRKRPMSLRLQQAATGEESTIMKGVWDILALFGAAF